MGLREELEAHREAERGLAQERQAKTEEVRALLRDFVQMASEAGALPEALPYFIGPQHAYGWTGFGGSTSVTGWTIRGASSSRSSPDEPLAVGTDSVLYKLSVLYMGLDRSKEPEPIAPEDVRLSIEELKRLLVQTLDELGI